MKFINTHFRESIKLENGKYLSRERWFTAIADEPLRITKPRIDGGIDPLSSLLLEEEGKLAKKIFSSKLTPEVFPGEYRISKKGNPVFEFKKDGPHRFILVEWGSGADGRTKSELSELSDLVIKEYRTISGRRRSGNHYYIINSPITKKLIGELLENL